VDYHRATLKAERVGPVSNIDGFRRVYTNVGREMPSKPSSVELADTVSDLLYGVAGWLLLVLGVAASLSGLGGLVQQAGTTTALVPALVLGLGVLFAISGMFVSPRFRRRIDRRHERSRFGQVETVESGTVSSAEDRHERCVRCGSGQNGSGLARRFRREYVVAGVPVWTSSEKRNFYCPRCALNEFPSLSTTDANDSTAHATVETE
jgi:hypothetical protein